MRPWGRIIAASWLILALICGAAPARAENEALSGLLQYDQYNGVVGNGSGGFIVVGAQNTERPPQSVAKLRVFDAAGSLLFDRAIRPRDAVSAALADVVRLADGDVVATGWIQRTGATSDNCWVIRAAPDGSVRWSTTTTGPAHERCYFVTALADGTVLVGGRSEGDTSGNAATVGAYWRVNAGTGALGDPTRVACDQPATRCAFQDGLALADGSLALVGWLTDPARGDDDIWVIRRDRAGQDTVRRRIGGPGADLANAVQARSDGGIFVIGYATGVNDATSGVVFALNEGGSTVWTRQVRVGSAGNDKLLSGVLLPNETLVAAGAASNDAAAPFNGWLVYFGAKGETIRERVFDWPPGGRFTAIATSNGDLAAVGAARAADGSDTDGWLARLDPPLPGEATNAAPAAAMHAAGGSLAAGASTAAQSSQQDLQEAQAQVEWPITIAPGGQRAYGFRLTKEPRAFFGDQELFPDIRKDSASARLKISQPSPMRGYVYVNYWDNDWGGLQGAIVSSRTGHILVEGIPQSSQVRGTGDPNKVIQVSYRILWSPQETVGVTEFFGGLAAVDIENGWYTLIPFPEQPTLADSVLEGIAWISESKFAAEISTYCHHEAVAEGLCEESKLAPYTINVDLRDQTLARTHSLPLAAKLEARRLQSLTLRERITQVFAGQGNMAIQIARAKLASPSSSRPTAAVVRIASAEGGQAVADWPLRLSLADGSGEIAEPGWYVISGNLKPDPEIKSSADLPSATIAVSSASRCESEGCASTNDLIAMLNAAYRLKQHY